MANEDVNQYASTVNVAIAVASRLDRTQGATVCRLPHMIPPIIDHIHGSGMVSSTVSGAAPNTLAGVSTDRVATYCWEHNWCASEERLQKSSRPPAGTIEVARPRCRPAHWPSAGGASTESNLQMPFRFAHSFWMWNDKEVSVGLPSVGGL